MAAEDLTHDLHVLTVAWRSLGLRGATVEWRFERPVSLSAPLAGRLRSALGPALERLGARPATLSGIPGSSRPAAFWFRGWDVAEHTSAVVRVEFRCVGVLARDWLDLRRALVHLRLPEARTGALAGAARCSMAWQGSPENDDPSQFGPAIGEGAPFTLEGGGSCVVDAVTPLQLRSGHRPVTGPPPLPVLVRSAGERLRQLCLHWGTGADVLPATIGRAVREADQGRLLWAQSVPERPLTRRSSSTRQTQVIGGIRGSFAYEDVSPLAMTVLAVATEIGAGKDTAFGCGQVRLYGAAPADEKSA